MRTELYLCQLNVAKMKTNLDDPLMADFVNALDYINRLAEQHSGFVWRLKVDQSETNPYFGSDVVVNMSIWEDAAALTDFVYRSQHKDYLRRKAEWFKKMDVYQVMWWVPQGHEPTIAEGKHKLDLLATKGPSDEAFGLKEALRAHKNQEISIESAQVE